MEAHFASLWESIADAIGDQPALVQGAQRRTWSEFDDRSARLAAGLRTHGLTAGSKVAQFLYNAPEFVESYTASLKMRAVPLNVNYRYLDHELAYLLENADTEALVYHSSLADTVAKVLDRLPRLRTLIEVDDGGPRLAGALRYEDVIAGHEPAERIVRSADDVTMIYTGGTTGMPKGVVVKIGPVVQAMLATVPPMLGLDPIDSLEAVAPLTRLLADEGRQYASLPAPPLIHNTGLAIGTLPALAFGGRIVLLEGRGLDVEELWGTVEREQVNGITIVGDAFARPMLRALDERPDRSLDSVALLSSSGAMFSTEVKARLLEHLPQAAILDLIGASEGLMGLSISTKGAVAPTGRFLPSPGVTVFTEDDRRVGPGSGEVGSVALPGGAEGYYKDEEKTAKTFRTIDGVRYTIPGDFATVEADGSISLLGRGSQCINTGGEKVFPEEVEEILKAHPGIEDCLVFGVPDERFGQRVVGVASYTAGARTTVEEVLAEARTCLAAFKLPRHVVVVDEVPRTPVGKADYPAAKDLFESSAPR